MRQNSGRAREHPTVCRPLLGIFQSAAAASSVMLCSVTNSGMRMEEEEEERIEHNGEGRERERERVGQSESPCANKGDGGTAAIAAS